MEPEGAGSDAGAGRRDRASLALALLLAVAVALAYHLALGREDLGLQDEGFLWYGVQRTAAGEVPLRDFQSYEPGRYYWSAAWARVLGDGLLPLRASLAALMAVGLGCGLAAARRALPPGRWSAVWLVPIAAVLALWMFPRHKLAEPAVALAAVWLGTRFLESPTPRRHLLLGVFAGLAGFVGRNHALYCTLGFALLAALVAWKRPEEVRSTSVVRRAGLLVGGGLLGSLPLLGMFAFVPGFAASYVESVRFFIEHGSNHPLPVPWPWRQPYGDYPLLPRVTLFFGGFAFLLAPVLAVLGIAAGIFATRDDLPRRALAIAGGVLGLVYLHHAVVRSDPMHLAQCIHAALLSGLALPCAVGLRRAWPLALGVWLTIFATSLFGATASNTELGRYHPIVRSQPLVRVTVQGEQLRVPAGIANYLGSVQALVSRSVAPDETLLIAPNRPTLYPVLGKVSPVWGLYFLWPAETHVQRAMIDQLEQQGIDFALICDLPVDGRPDMLFRNTHPLVWAYLIQRFAAVQAPDVPRGHVFLRRRSR